MAWPNGQPRMSQISCVSAGFAVPLKTLKSVYKARIGFGLDILHYPPLFREALAPSGPTRAARSSYIAAALRNEPETPYRREIQRLRFGFPQVFGRPRIA